MADVICILKLCSNSSVPCFSVGQDCDVLNVTENSICCKTPSKPIIRTVYPGKLPEERMAISHLQKKNIIDIHHYALVHSSCYNIML